MKKTIVITSIYPPTEAIRQFAQQADFNLLVVGDKKTPLDWHHPDVTFISAAEQAQSGNRLATLLPFNHYCRKMCGYIRAMEMGADLIVDTDDDNIPYDHWAFPPFSGAYDYLPENLNHINIYQLFAKQKIWPRGLPLELINTDFALQAQLKKRDCKVGIWQGLADRDPDVDAIYRLTCDQECLFSKRDPLVLGAGTLSPFNSQNTAIIKALFPLLYLPCYVTFRFTDILRGWVAQPLMWLYGYHLGFVGATVYQDRNPHDYMQDFISEIPMYSQGAKVPEIVSKTAIADASLSDNLFNVYVALAQEKIVPKQELATLEAWLKECGRYTV